MTRQNSIPQTAILNGNDNEELSVAPSAPALIPLWDLANHLDGTVTSSFNVETNQIEGAAMFDFQRGDQIFIYYGPRNNTNFLVHNG